MSSNGSGKVVCVTGASGFIASWLVKLLLRRGYTVNATVRDPNDPKKTEHLRALDGAKERLHLFKSDLVEGCVGVFHTASPISFSPADPQAELIETALNGTLNVLKSCAKVRSIKRVVVTSSTSTIVCNGKPLTNNVIVDETWYSDPVFLKEQKFWYMVSKTLAEDAACKFGKENDIDVVFMNPGLVIGPLLQPRLNFSVEVILGFITGVNIYPDTSYRTVDVRDVAFAHIQAFEIPSAKGRYCLVGKAATSSDIRKILQESYPTLILPEKFSDNDKREPGTYQVSKEKAESLGSISCH